MTAARLTPPRQRPDHQQRDEQAEPAGRAWRDRAVCRDGDPELFFPTAEAGPARYAQVKAAKAVCARCPVRAECLDEALARIPYGIAGGLTEHERQLRRIHADRAHAAATSGPTTTHTHKHRKEAEPR